MKIFNLNKTRVFFEASLVTFVFITLLGSTTFLVYSKSLSTLDQEIKIGLLSNVKAAASRIDGDLHQSFNSNTSREDVAYLSQAQPLEMVRQVSKGVRYIYTNILSNNEVYFVVNPSPQNDSDGDGFPDLAPALMTPYVDYPKELMQALVEDKAYVSERPYTDIWGTFISAYAPFYDKKGNQVGTLGMDLELSGFYQRLEKINIVFEKATITIIFLGVVVGLAVWFMRRSVMNELDNYAQLKLKTRSKQQNNRFNAQLLLTLQASLLERFNQGDIDKNTYITKLKELDNYGQNLVRASNKKASVLSPNELLEAITHKINLDIKKRVDSLVPNKFSSNFDELITQLSQLILALEQLATPEDCRLSIVDEQALSWKLQLEVICQGSEHSHMMSDILSGVPDGFNYPDPLQPNGYDQACLKLHQIYNCLPYANATLAIPTDESHGLEKFIIQVQFEVNKV